MAASTIILLGYSFAGGYLIGFNKGVDSIKNPKGDGSHFYMECFDDEQNGSTYNNAELLLYHSIPVCPNIKNGTERDGYGNYETYTKRKVPYIFCPKCMDNHLIDICEVRIISAYPDDVKN